uniref:hypothetical protein n=1 Tax=Saccharothrix mutabilis TaxID=33921 RepID=UPI0031CFE2C7
MVGGKESQAKRDHRRHTHLRPAKRGREPAAPSPAAPNLPRRTCRAEPAAPNLPRRTCRAEPAAPNLPRRTCRAEP